LEKRPKNGVQVTILNDCIVVCIRSTKNDSGNFSHARKKFSVFSVSRQNLLDLFKKIRKRKKIKKFFHEPAFSS